MMARFNALLLALFATISVAVAQPADSLPSWNDGATKKAITDFVARVTAQGGAEFVPAEQRIATFDNDGTLWTEQPYYFQLAFAFDRVKAMAPQHPEWKMTQPFKALLDGRVGHAALDVRAKEPPDPADDPLEGIENVTHTPHMAATSQEATRDLHRLAAHYLLEVLENAGCIPAAVA